MADLLLGIVDLSGIQMVIPEFDGGLDGVDESAIDAGVVAALVPLGTGFVRVVSFVNDEGRKVKLTAIADLGNACQLMLSYKVSEAHVPPVSKSHR